MSLRKFGFLYACQLFVSSLLIEGEQHHRCISRLNNLSYRNFAVLHFVLATVSDQGQKKEGG